MRNDENLANKLENRAYSLFVCLKYATCDGFVRHCLTYPCPLNMKLVAHSGAGVSGNRRHSSMTAAEQPDNCQAHDAHDRRFGR